MTRPKNSIELRMTNDEDRAEVANLRAQVMQDQDIKFELRDLIRYFQETLGVETEPHQSFDERMREAIDSIPAEFKRLEAELTEMKRQRDEAYETAAKLCESPASYFIYKEQYAEAIRALKEKP